ncbi:alpha/beta hydrolase [Paenibacillus lautus]|uniref:alpha/beta hydrolase n=1 Tax=Paenibacillus lautus TaxID=1401 RepID=UPI003D9A0DB9
MRITEDTTLGTIYTKDSLKDAKSYLMGNAETYFQEHANLTLKELNTQSPTWYSKDMAYGLNRLVEIAEEEKTFLYQVYSQVEIEAEPDKKEVHLFHFPGSQEGRFAILLAGGAYQCVCSMQEAFPAAAKLNELGITAFCLNYRTGQSGLLPKPMEDLAAAFRLIHKRAGQFHIDPASYAVGGFSAGGHVAAGWGTEALGYRKYGLPAPELLMLGYPFITTVNMTDTVSEEIGAMFLQGMFGAQYTDEIMNRYNVDQHIDAGYPPVYIVHSKNDDTVPIYDADCFIAALDEAGVNYKAELPDTGGHGFGLGSATPVAGWIERAAAFWKDSNKHSYLSAVWMDPSEWVKTDRIEQLCKADYIEQQLKVRFPNEELKVTAAEINDSGVFENPLGRGLPPQYAAVFTSTNLPAYCDIRVERKTPGNHTEHIIVWSPLAWNGRFMGTAGGGNQTGGLFHIVQTDNANRGMSLPNAVCNGFTAANTDGGNHTGNDNWGIEENRTLDGELIRNWESRSTHWMTLIGKAVAEILHGRAPAYSYMHGSSGGGRQAMKEAQQYPEDYDGIWASCPAINWSKFVIGGLWPLAVMNEHENELSPAKLEAFRASVHRKCGGSEAFHGMTERVDINPLDLAGQETEDGVITEMDAIVMKEIWDGPRTADGQQLWYFFRPGSLFWNAEGTPVTALYYVKDETGVPRVKIFPLCIAYARWVARDPEQDFSRITKEEFAYLFERSVADFSEAATDDADLKAFWDAGGKLLMDHGTDDPLIPPDGALDYYNRVVQQIGSKEDTVKFFRLFLNPGDGHGNCYTHGPGLTKTGGMKALMDWVERGIAPEKLQGLLVDPQSKKLLRESELTVY